MSQAAARATTFVLRVLDVGASIDLERAERALSSRGATRGPSTLRGPAGPGAGGVVLSRSPLDVPLGELVVGGVTVVARLRLFAFGIASCRFELPVDGAGVAEVSALARFVDEDAGFDDAARASWRDVSRALGDAVQSPSSIDYIEDFAVFVLPALPGVSEAEQRETVTRLLLGERSPRALSRRQIDDAWGRAISYFDDDLVLVDYDAAVVIDPTCSADVVDIFELASAHLLELRYYDSLLARASSQMAEGAAKHRGRLFRSPFEELAERAVDLLLEVAELTDSFEHSITLMGDTYSVQVYRAAAERFRIPEAAAAVEGKLAGFARSVEVLSGHVQHRRGLVLEVLVVVLIMLEIVLAIFKH